MAYKIRSFGGVFFCDRNNISLALLLGTLLFACGWLQSLHFLPWVSWQSEAWIFASAVFYAFGTLCVRGSIAKVPIVLGLTVPLLIIVIVVLQYAAGYVVYGGDATVLITYAVLAMISIWVGYVWGLREGEHTLTRSIVGPWEMLAASLCFSALMSVGVMLVQSLDLSIAFEWISQSDRFRRPGANLGQPNHVGTLLLWGVSSTWYLFLKKRISGLVTFITVVWLGIGLAITESRTSLVSAALMTTIFYASQRETLSLRSKIGMGVAWGIYLIALIAWPWGITSFHEGGLPTGAHHVSTSAGTRWMVWGQLWQAILMRPWLGWGVREVSKAHNAVVDAYDASEPFTYAHNIIVDMGIGWGIPLTLVAVIGAAWWIFTRLRVLGSESALYSALLLAAFTMHSMLEFPFAYAYFLMPTMIAVGLLEAKYKFANSWHAPPMVLRSVLAAYAAVLIWTGFEYIGIEEDFRVARFEVARVGHTPSEYSRPNVVLLTQLDGLLQAARIRPQPDMQDLQLQVLRNASMRFPWPALQSRYALALALNGNAFEAVRQLKVIRALHGQDAYEDVKAKWIELANTQYPQLKAIDLL